MKSIPSSSLPGNVAALPSRIDAFFVENGYWHLEVWLRSPAGQRARLFTSEHNIAKWFDVSSIEIDTPEHEPPKWTLLGREALIVSVEPLWREEWLTKGASGPTVGADPHTQWTDAIGTAPADAVAVVRVLAGVLLRESSGPGIAVTAATTAPLNVDLSMEPSAISKVLEGHSIGDWDNAS